jgi:hypothetical protein
MVLSVAPSTGFVRVAPHLTPGATGTRGFDRSARFTKSDFDRLDRVLAGKPLPKDPDVRTFFDPLSNANLSNALPTPVAKPFDAAAVARALAKGWSLS